MTTVTVAPHSTNPLDQLAQRYPAATVPANELSGHDNVGVLLSPWAGFSGALQLYEWANDPTEYQSLDDARTAARNLRLPGAGDRAPGAAIIDLGASWSVAPLQVSNGAYEWLWTQGSDSDQLRATHPGVVEIYSPSTPSVSSMPVA